MRNTPLETVAPADGAPGADPSRPASGPRPGRVASDKAGSVAGDTVDLVLPWLVAAVTLVARLATAASGPTDWDSSQFAAAVSRFDVTHGRPQPPGYFLYVVVGRLVHAVGPGTVTALVVVSALASAAAAGLVVVAGRDLGGRWVGVCAGLLVATSPFAWFSGSVVDSVTFWSLKRRRWANPSRSDSAPVSGSSRRLVRPRVSRLLSEIRSWPM